MSSSSLPLTTDSGSTEAGCHDRLRCTATFRAKKFYLWRESLIGVAGCGVIGERLGKEIVRSGASVLACDPQSGEVVNFGNQDVENGSPKVRCLVNACDAIERGRATGLVSDIRNVGIGVLRRLDVLIDATDDPNLSLFMTEVSNGLAIPRLRAAVDGSGEYELGRVLCSHGGGGYSCEMCPYDLTDLANFAKSLCPNRAATGDPTIAGGAIGMAIAGLALLQAQRLVTGNDLDLVLEREVILNLTQLQITPIHLPRCGDGDCLSGHVAWQLLELNRRASETSLVDLFHEARRAGLSTTEEAVTLEPFGNPLCTAAECRECGNERHAVGSLWGTPPSCGKCGKAMAWRSETQIDRLTAGQTRDLGIGQSPLDSLGLPASGPMVVARSPGKTPLRFLLS